jgi:hypothetical protein
MRNSEASGVTEGVSSGAVLKSALNTSPDAAAVSTSVPGEGAQAKSDIPNVTVMAATMAFFIGIPPAVRTKNMILSYGFIISQRQGLASRAGGAKRAFTAVLRFAALKIGLGKNG